MEELDDVAERDPEPPTNACESTRERVRAVLITGYERYPLVDGSGFLTDPVFWAVHSMIVGTSGLNDLEGSFGVDVDDAEALCEQLFDHDGWPVSVPLRRGS